MEALVILLSFNNSPHGSDHLYRYIRSPDIDKQTLHTDPDIILSIACKGATFQETLKEIPKCPGD